MYWENKLYVFTLALVAGILVTFGIFPAAPVPVLLAFFAAVLLAGLALGFVSFKKHGYIAKAPTLIVFYAVPFLLGVLLTHNALSDVKKGHILKELGDAKTVQAKISGYIYCEPEYFEDRVRVYLAPETVTPKGGEALKIKKGRILVNYSFEKGKFPSFLEYGNYIEFEALLQRPSGETNPGGFNYKKFLESTGVYYTAFLNDRSDVTLLSGTKRNAFVVFSLNLKRKFLSTIRKTVPYPESAFLGGITLGLRYGLEGIFLPGSDFQIKDDFKRSGVNHVLAVSGLHVTIITVFFLGFFSLVGVPKRWSNVITVIFLIIFAIITGGRPSTLRAVIMHGFILLVWAFSKKNLRASVAIGIAVAGLSILLVNPLLLREASFSLSFGAVLSLIILTPFIDDLFKKYLIGYAFWAGVLVVAAFTCLNIVMRESFYSPPVILSFFAAAGVFLFFVNKLEERTKLPFPSYRKIPGYLISFISSQFAIQFGMMLPLSAYYFGRYPIAGMYANYVAIPLVGVNVQVGMMAVIASLIPVAGVYIALLLNAANWILLKFFIQSAHFFSTAFPYPFVKKLGFKEILYYYIVLFIILNIPWIKARLLDVKYYTMLYQQKKDKRHKLVRAAPLSAVILFIAVTVFLLFPPRRQYDADITFFSLARGNCVFIRTLKNKNILINAGRHSLYKKREWDEADRVIMNSLMHYGISGIDKFILTDLSDENASAASTILKEYPVKSIYLPTNIEDIKGLSYDDFVNTAGSDYLMKNMGAYWVKSRYDSALVVNKIRNAKNIPLIVVKTGDYIHSESVTVGNSEKRLEIYALAPLMSGKSDYFNDNLVIKVDYTYLRGGLEIGKKQFLIFGDHDRGRTKELLKQKEYFGRTDVLAAPARFLWNDDFKKVVSHALPADFLFHVDHFKQDEETMEISAKYGFLSDKAGSNFFNISQGYVRYLIRDADMYRKTAADSGSIEDTLTDNTFEF